MLDLNAGHLFKALSAIDQARSILSESGKRNWPFWLYVNQPYGLVLIRLGRSHDAIVPLQIAVETEQRMRISSSAQLTSLLRGLDTGIVGQLLRVENTRQAASTIETDGLTPRTIKELLLDQSTGTMDALELLVHAYALTGQFSEASSILDVQVKAAQRVQIDTTPLPLALEYRLFKMGASLSGTGDRKNAAKAFDAALSLNFLRLRRAVIDAIPLDNQQAIYAVRRLQLSASLGNVDFKEMDSNQTTELVSRIIETKGLGVRYAERLNQLLNASTSPQAVAAR
ncbi:MAG: hypothetical protein ABI606_23365, partial [Rhodoferax sp.]